MVCSKKLSLLCLLLLVMQPHTHEIKRADISLWFRPACWQSSGLCRNDNINISSSDIENAWSQLQLRIVNSWTRTDRSVYRSLGWLVVSSRRPCSWWWWTKIISIKSITRLWAPEFWAEARWINWQTARFGSLLAPLALIFAANCGQCGRCSHFG